MDIIKAYATKNLCYITSQKMIPKGIVVHSTGANNPYLRRYVDAPDKVGVNKYGNHWNTATPDGRKVCVHAFIGYDKNKNVRVAEILPLNICCWGVGSGSRGSYNYDPAYIQFEICEDDLTDKNYYRKVFTVAAQYCAKLCSEYNISIDKIVGHCEAYKLGYGSNHSDPEHWMKKFEESMEDFRRQVSEILKKNKGKNENSAEPKKDKSSKNIEIQKGDLVSILSDAVYYTGKTVPKWVKSQKWYVKENPVGNKVIIDKNEDGSNSICSPIHKKYLTVAKRNDKNISVGTFIPYRVKITATELNIRKGPGTNTAKVGCIKDKGVYTIIEEKNGIGATKWGRLKSKVGWISLDYTKKL